jgi:hypothetical protein
MPAMASVTTKLKRKGGVPDMEQSLVNKMHERLGCFGCKFADKETLGKDACCTYKGRIEVDDEGKCKMREETPDQTWMH